MSNVTHDTEKGSARMQSCAYCASTGRYNAYSRLRVARYLAGTAPSTLNGSIAPDLPRSTRTLWPVAPHCHASSGHFRPPRAGFFSADWPRAIRPPCDVRNCSRSSRIASCAARSEGSWFSHALRFPLDGHDAAIVTSDGHFGRRLVDDRCERQQIRFSRRGPSRPGGRRPAFPRRSMA
jgi:hypothetical protein